MTFIWPTMLWFLFLVPVLVGAYLLAQRLRRKYALRYAALIRQKLPGCVVGAYMCPWLPDEHAGALRRPCEQSARYLRIHSALTRGQASMNSRKSKNF